MTTSTTAVPAVANGLDAAQRARFPVAIINNDWAPTLAFAFSLGQQGIPLHFFGPGAGRWSRYCRRHAVCPPVGRADIFIPWLQSRLRSGEITRLAPTTDLIAYYMAVLREDFPADVRRTIAPLEEIERCLIKTRFAAACEGAGQAVPSQAAPEDLDEAVAAARSLGYPIMIKPKSHLVVGVKERGRLVRNEQELRKHFHPYTPAPGQGQIAADYPELRWPMLQRYVPTAKACVYSVSGIKDAQRGVLAATLTCKRQQWPPDVGVSTVQALCRDERILARGVATIDKLLSRGLFELELLTDGDTLLAIDLNPRAFGFMTLDIAADADLPWLWWQTSVNVVEPPARRTAPAELECRFAVPYYFGKTINWLLRSRDPRFSAESSQARTAWVSMLGRPSDPLPMLLANLQLLRLLPHRGGLIRPFVSAAWRARRGAVVEA